MIIFEICLFIYILFAFLLTIGRMSPVIRHRLLFAGIIFVLFVVTFRPLDVPDTQSYKEIFNMVDINRNYGFVIFGSKEYTTGCEYGFVIFIQFIKRFISSDYRVFFLIVASIEVLLCARFIKKICGNDVRKEAYLIYFIMPYFGFIYLCVIIRAGIALTIALNAFAIKRKRSVWIKILLYIIAFSFHRSVMIMLLVEVVYSLMPIFSKNIYWILWGVNGILVFMNTSRLYSLVLKGLNYVGKVFSFLRYQHYFSNVSIAGRGLTLRIAFFWILGLLLLNSKNETSEEYNKYYNVYIAGLFVMNACSFIDGASRIYNYFMIVLPILLTERYLTNTSLISKKYILWGMELLYGIAGVAIIIRL